MGQLLRRVLSIADLQGDDEDVRLRKRVGVTAGYVTTGAALVLPFLGDWSLLTVVGAASVASANAINLAVLARTKRFDSYVIVSLLAAAAYTLFADTSEGGLAASGGCVVWALLIPVFAILFLGPRRAVPWFALFLALVATIVLIDPLVSGGPAPVPYAVQLTYWVENVGVPGTIIFLLLRYTDVRRLAAQARSEDLLTNAIPASIATRLKLGERRIAERYPETTILFADIAGFTPWALRTDPDRLVALLDQLFTRFDRLAVEHGVEKIKTIGDAYMAAAGTPIARSDHAQAALAMAHGMLDVFADWRATVAPELELRIGLASGPVVAGVIGDKRVLFDVWGETVNVASRMQSSGVPGRIQVSESTWILLREQEAFQPRERMEIKGLGMTATYLASPQGNAEPGAGLPQKTVVPNSPGIGLLDV